MAIFDEKIEVERCNGFGIRFQNGATVQRSALCRSRRELSREYFVLQNLASVQPRTSLLKFEGGGTAFLGAKIKSTQAMLKKTEDEAAFYDCQVLTARRFISTTPSQEDRHRARPPLRIRFTRSSVKFRRGAPRRAPCRRKCTNQEPQPSSLARAERPAVA